MSTDTPTRALPAAAPASTSEPRHDSVSFGAATVVALLMIYAVVWTITDPYAGLVHDAKLYAMQAMATLQPEIFRGDLFLKYGSQDSFTVFPRIYAPVAAAIGLERAAAAFTLVFSLLWLGLGYLVARRLWSTRLALLSLGFLVAIPGWYGSYQVIHVGEMYLNARLPAEVAGLAAVLCHLQGKRIAGFVLAALSVMLHPVMGVAVVGFLMLLEVHGRLGLRGVQAAALAAIVGGAVVTIAWPVPLIDMDPRWQAIVYTRSGWLFPELWRVVDWQYQALLLGTLALLHRVSLDERTRAVASGAMWLGLAGLVLSIIAGLLPDHPILLRAQTWRWVWLSCVLAIVALPGVLYSLWTRGTRPLDRSAALLIATGWLTADAIGGVLALVALALTFLPADRTAPYERAARLGAGALLFLTCIVLLVPAFQYAARPFDTNADTLAAQRLVNFLAAPAVGLVVVCAFWWAALRLHPHRARAYLLAAGALLILATTIPRAVRDWTSPKYPPQAAEAFVPWRALIPSSAEVLWPGEAMATWAFLERRHYLSMDQLAGILYSAAMTDEFVRRAEGLRPLAKLEWWTLEDNSPEAHPKPLTPALLVEVCRAPGLDFVVHEADLGGAIATASMPGREITFYLHDCRVTRHAAGSQ